METKRRNKTSNTYTRRNTTHIALMPKSRHSRMNEVRTYKANCHNNKLYGYKTLKSGEDNTDFGHVLMGKLDGYDGPIIVKVSDTDVYFKREKYALHSIENFEFHAKIICDFSCNDDKERWMKNINKPVKLCIGKQPLHFFIIEYIRDGELADNIKNITDMNELRALLMQIMYCFIELGQKYKLFHGDIHSANILIDKTETEFTTHIINGQERLVKSYGKMPKLIDFGRSGRFYGESPTHTELIYELMIAVSVCNHYVNHETVKTRINALLIKQETEFKDMDEFVNAIAESCKS